jgi:hypothetical protein
MQMLAISESTEELRLLAVLCEKVGQDGHQELYWNFSNQWIAAGNRNLVQYRPQQVD